MMIVSILQDRIQTFKINGGFLTKKNYQFKAGFLDPADVKTFNIDKWAMALKEALSDNKKNKYKQKKVKVILGLRFWNFERLEIPVDIKKENISNFLQQKLNENQQTSLEYFQFFLAENRGKTFANVFSLNQKQITDLQTLFSFYDLQISQVYPEPILLFQLFSQTLSTKKEELILFLEYNQNMSYGLLYDYLGLKENTVIYFDSKNIVSEIKDLNKKQNNSLCRLILSGQNVEKIRQDNFTKETGVWTNPLNKILNTNEYLQFAAKFGLEKESLGFCRELVLLKIISDKAEDKYALNIGKKNKFKMPIINKLNPSTALLPKKRPNWNAFGRLVFFLTLSAGLTFALFNGYLFLQKKVFTAKKITPPAVTTPAQKKAITQTPKKASVTKAKEKLSRDKIIIEIQNGSGITGVAGKLKSLLEDLGYTVKSVSNADNFDYQTTLIIAPEKAIFNQLVSDLKNNLEKGTNFEKTNSEQITIIIGKDFSP